MTPDCEIARNQLGSDSSAELGLGHLESCPDCQAWFETELVSAGGAPAGGTASGLEELEAAMARETGLAARMRSLPTGVRVRLWALVVLVVACAQLLIKPRPDLAVYPVTRLALEVLFHALVIGAIGALLLRPSYKPAWPRFSMPFVAAGALLLPVLIAATNPAHAAHPESLLGVGSDYWPRALRCFRYGALMGLPLLALAAISERSGSMSVAKLLGLLAGGTALGSLALTLHCPLVSPAHLWLGHAAIAMPLLLASAFALRITRTRAVT